MTETTLEDIQSEIRGAKRREQFAGKFCECGHVFEMHEAWDETHDECDHACDCGQFRFDENRIF